MTMSISPGDWETLSAYVDNQLGERERVQIEARLRAEPELRGALQEIRRAKAVLWYAPRRRAPRNFTLSPGKAGVRLTSPLYPTFRLASVLASLMFVLVLVGDLLAGVTTGVPVLAQMAPREVAQMQAVELAMPASAPLAEAPAEAFNQAADQAALAPAPTQAPESTQAVASAPAEEYGVGGGPAAKAAPTASPTPTLPPTSTPLPTLPSAAEAEVQPVQPAQGKQPAETSVLARVEPTESALFTIPYINHWLVWGLEGLFLALAGLALVAALITRRMR